MMEEMHGDPPMYPHVTHNRRRLCCCTHICWDHPIHKHSAHHRCTSFFLCGLGLAITALETAAVFHCSLAAPHVVFRVGCWLGPALFLTGLLSLLSSLCQSSRVNFVGLVFAVLTIIACVPGLILSGLESKAALTGDTGINGEARYMAPPMPTQMLELICPHYVFQVGCAITVCVCVGLAMVCLSIHLYSQMREIFRQI